VSVNRLGLHYSHFVPIVVQHFRSSLFEGTLRLPISSLLHWSGQSAFPTVQCNYICGDLPLVHVCSESAQMQCSSAKGIMHSPLLRTALQNRLTTGLCHCKYTYEDVMLTQVCNAPPPVHCSTARGNMHSPLVRTALHNRLTAGLCHCKYICEDFLLTQVCIAPPLRSALRC